MSDNAIISIDQLAKSLQMQPLVRGKGSIEFTSSEINRPGLQFTGYYKHFAEERVQLIGNAEMNYLYSLKDDDLFAKMDYFMSRGIPCVVCARSNKPPEILIDRAQRHLVPIFLSARRTDEIGHLIGTFVGRYLAPKIKIHGVLIDVFGVGILLIGESGIGKSETALEMIKQGHRLVSDDIVEITRVEPDKLVGYAPEVTRHLMEVRGVGIVDVRYMFGASAEVPEKTIDMIIEMELWDQARQYERLGNSEVKTELLGVDVPKIVIPVRPGRNLAVVLEVAARSFRLKRLGYDADADFKDRKIEIIERMNVDE